MGCIRRNKQKAALRGANVVPSETVKEVLREVAELHFPEPSPAETKAGNITLANHKPRRGWRR